MTYEIISKFIKDITFEIPSAETFVMLDKEIKKYSLVFDVSSKNFKRNIIEVNLILKLIPKQETKRKINVEINVTALVSIKGDLKDNKAIEKIILVNVPTDLYPMLYDTFVYLFNKSGIEKIGIKKEVNFENLPREKIK